MKTSIYKRKDGRFEARIRMGRDAKGKIIYKYIYEYSYEACAQRLATIMPSNPNNPDIPSTFITYDELCQEWLRSLFGTLKDSSIATYSYTLKKYLLPAFGKYPLYAVTTPIINDFIEQLSSHRTYRYKNLISPSTVHHIIVVLKITFAFAEKTYSILNPCKNLQKTKALKRTQQVSDSDWKHIRFYLKNDTSKTASAISIAVHMGMRLGEICALKRKDIDFENKILYVQRTVQRIRNAYEASSKTQLIIGSPKSSSSRRIIPIPEILLSRFHQLCKNRNDDDFIFGRTRSRVLDPRTLQYRFRNYLKRHNIPIINFHQLRHKFAGTCIEKKFDVKSLSEILGHSDVNITLNYYVHPTIAFKRKQINMLSDD